MIIYGTGEKKLSVPDNAMKGKCPQCGEMKVGFHFFKTYFHLFWIPVFPFRSRRVALCENCHTGYTDNIPPSLQFEYDNARHMTRTPLYLFSGSGIIVLLVLYFTFVYEVKPTTYTYPSGIKQAIGKYNGDKLDGPWTFWYENGNIQSEHFYKNGVEDGEWTWYDSAGNKTKIGHYKDGISHGKWTFFYPDGSVMEEFTHYENRTQGPSVTYFANGKKSSEGSYERDHQQGPWKFWFDNGNIFMEGDYETSEQRGLWKIYYENGKLQYERKYTDSLMYIINYWNEEGTQLVTNGNGRIHTYYPDKQIESEGEVKEGLYTGMWTYYHSNGLKSVEGRYTKGKYELVNSWTPEGIMMVTSGIGYHKSFYDNGVVEFECSYKDGKMNGVYLARNEFNQLINQLTYVNGELHGIAKYFHEEGSLQAKGEFQHNKREGTWTWYYIGGEKESEVNYVNGKKEGEQTFWSESSQINKKEYYKHGELQKETVL